MQSAKGSDEVNATLATRFDGVTLVSPDAPMHSAASAPQALLEAISLKHTTPSEHPSSLSPVKKHVTLHVTLAPHSPHHVPSSTPLHVGGTAAQPEAEVTSEKVGAEAEKDGGDGKGYVRVSAYHLFCAHSYLRGGEVVGVSDKEKSSRKRKAE